MLIKSLLFLLHVLPSEFLFLCIECPANYFGMDCNERCSGHCMNNEPCDHVRGECINSCQDGYIGAFCSDGTKHLFVL